MGLQDSFFALGGDSIRSVRAVALAHEQGFDLSVQDLFRRRRSPGWPASWAGGGATSEDDEDLASLLDELDPLAEEGGRCAIRERTGETVP